MTPAARTAGASLMCRSGRTRRPAARTTAARPAQRSRRHWIRNVKHQVKPDNSATLQLCYSCVPVPSRAVIAVLHSWVVGTLHQITEHRRFDPAELTLSTSRDLAAAPDGRLAPVVLDRLDGVAAMLARSYPQVGPFRLMSPVAALLSETARRARSAPAGERQRLVLTLVHLGVLAGHMSFDLGQTGYVDGYFGGALSAVDEAGDSDMRVWALASWSVVPVNTRAPARAAELLDDAVWLARRGRSPSRLGWVLALRARAMADLGERRQALALLSDAYEVLTEPQ